MSNGGGSLPLCTRSLRVTALSGLGLGAENALDASFEGDTSDRLSLWFEVCGSFVPVNLSQHGQRLAEDDS